MPAARAEIVVTASTAEAQAKLEELAIKTKVASEEMSTSTGNASTKMESKFTSLGKTMGTFGLPMSSQTQKIGKELDKASSHASGFSTSVGKSTSQVGKDLEETEGKAHGFGTAMQQYGGMAALAVAAVALEVGKMAVQAADAYDTVEVKVEQSVKNTGLSWDKYSSKINAVEKAQASLGFSMTDVAAAMAVGVTGTQSVTKALSYLPIAENLAAYKNIDLQSAMLLTTKAGEGQIRALKQLGIDLPIAASSAAKLGSAQDKLTSQQGVTKAALLAYRSAQANLLGVQAQAITKTYTQADKTKDLTAAVEEVSKAHSTYQSALNKTTSDQDKLNSKENTGKSIIKDLSGYVAGQATSATTTLAGKQRILNAEWTNSKVELGEGLIPKLEEASGALAAMLAIANGNWTSSNFMQFVTNFDSLANSNLFGIPFLKLPGAGSPTITKIPKGSSAADKASAAAWLAAHGSLTGWKPPDPIPHSASNPPPTGSGTPTGPGGGGGGGGGMRTRPAHHTTMNVTIVNPDPEATVKALRRYMNTRGAIPIRIAQ